MQIALKKRQVLGQGHPAFSGLRDFKEHEEKTGQRSYRSSKFTHTAFLWALKQQ